MLHQFSKLDIVIRPESDGRVSPDFLIHGPPDEVEGANAHVPATSGIACVPRGKDDEHHEPEGRTERVQKSPGHGDVGNRRQMIDLVRLHIIHGPPERRGMKHHVRVSEQNVVPLDLPRSRMQRIRLSDPSGRQRFHGQHGEALISLRPRFKNRPRPIRRPIVHRHNLQSGIIQSQDRPERLVQISFFIASGDHDRDPRQLLTGFHRHGCQHR